jgi:hypothetical protein
MMRLFSPRAALILVALFLADQGLVLDTKAQTKNLPEAKSEASQGSQGNPQPPAQAGGAKRPAKRYKLKVQEGEVLGVSLKADQARLSEIAAELSKSLKTRVILGPNMEKELITVEFYELTFEQAMRFLAPHVYVDYEIRSGASPKAMGIFLFAQNDPTPATTAVVTGSSQAMVIEGNTEDSTDNTASNDADDPLQVELDGSYLTLKSKKQPLAAVIATIAEVLEVPADVRYDSGEIIDKEIKDVPYEDAVTGLSANVRLYMRADLSRAERKPLRLVLVTPAEIKSVPAATTAESRKSPAQ